MAKDYYKILGLQRGASADEIKRAYRRLSKEYHPDKHKGEKQAEQKFKEINEAYEMLSDPKKKQMYDQFGTTGGPGGGFGGFDFSGFRPEDLGGFGDLFEQFFGGVRSARAAREERGRDAEVGIEVSFRDVVAGAQRKIPVEKFVACEKCTGSGAEKDSKLITCTECGGTGQVTRTAQSFFGTIQQSVLCQKCQGAGKVPEKPCGTCGGEGRERKHSEVTVDIPAGIHDGQTLRLRGEGEAGRRGSEAGDLYVHVRVIPDPQFERDGDDVRTMTAIPVVDAILGTEVPIVTVHGDVKLKIPAGTQSHQVFRIKGKGMPVLSTSRHGDHYVTVKVEIPKKLSRAEKKLVEEWRGLSK